MHVEVEQVCCTFIKQKQAQILQKQRMLGSTLTLAFHVVGTPVGHRVVLDVWQHAELARISVRDGPRLSTLVLGLTSQ